MGKKKKPKKRSAALQTQGVLTAGQREKIATARVNLEHELDDIEHSMPKLPPPPNVHEYVLATHREADDLQDTWVRISCETCAFLLFTRYKDMKDNISAASNMCALPFGTRGEADKLLRNWEAAVSRAYRELQADQPGMQMISQRVDHDRIES